MTEPQVDASRSKLLEYLPTSLAVLTASLGAIGGLTGGIARMFRNNPDLALLTLSLAIAAILAALLAQFWHRNTRRSSILVAAAILLFVGSVALGSYLAVDTARVTDRPSLTARLTQTPTAGWAIEGTAGASGLAAGGSLQLFIYAIPENAEKRSKLLFVTAGPNAEGVASQTFSVPLPTDMSYRSIVVTAALGDQPRWCDGTALVLTAGLKVTTPDDPVDGKNACVIVKPPPGSPVGSGSSSTALRSSLRGPHLRP